MIEEELTSWRERPCLTGWWWCIPDIYCFWYRLHPAGCIVHVTVIHDKYAETSWEDYAVSALSGGRVSLNKSDHLGLFGSWSGPIEFPEGNPDEPIIEAEFEIIDDQWGS